MAAPKTPERIQAEPRVWEQIGDVGLTIRSIADLAEVNYSVARRIVLDLFREGRLVRWVDGPQVQYGSNVVYVRREFWPHDAPVYVEVFEEEEGLTPEP
jgi:hypothetical protein